MKGIQVEPEAGGALPLRRIFDGCALTPLVEGRDQLPRSVRRDHVLDRGRPSRRVAFQAGSGLVRLPESGTDRKAEACLTGLSCRRRVLMPSIRLAGARPI